MLIIGRAVAGLGGSGLVNGALTIIAAIAPMQKRPGQCSVDRKLGILWLMYSCSYDGYHDGL